MNAESKKDTDDIKNTLIRIEKSIKDATLTSSLKMEAIRTEITDDITKIVTNQNKRIEALENQVKCLQDNLVYILLDFAKLSKPELLLSNQSMIKLVDSFKKYGNCSNIEVEEVIDYSKPTDKFPYNNVNKTMRTSNSSNELSKPKPKQVPTQACQSLKN